MTYDEYLMKIKGIEHEFEEKQKQLMMEYFRANNPYKIGDKITDHIGTIIIEKMGYAWGMFGEPPYAAYIGIEFNKNEKPNKKGNKRTVHQCNIIKNIKIED